MAKGWITLNRKIQDHWIWKNHEYSYAWIDLLLSVNHDEKKILIDGKFLTINRGQKLTSIYKLSQRWGWNRKKTYNFLNVLERDNMIERKSTTKYTIVTIVNYDKFQGQGSTKGTTEGTTKGTTKGQQRVHKQQYINNDINNETSNPHTSEEVPVAEEKEKRDPDRLYPGDPGYNPDRLYPGDPNYTDIDWGDDE